MRGWSLKRVNVLGTSYLAGGSARAGGSAGRVGPPAGLDSDVDRVDSFAGQNQSVSGQNLVQMSPIRPAAATVVDVVGELLVPITVITHVVIRSTTGSPPQN